MKKHKKRILPILLSLALMLSSMPGMSMTALAEGLNDDVNTHCTSEIIAKYGYDTLGPLVQRIKNEMVPKAVGALTEAYPAFKDEGAVGKEISLFVYGAEEEGSYDGKVKLDNIASVTASGTDEGYYYVLSINALPLLKDQNGTWVVDESQIETLENTLTHELLHAIMYDYNRTGMDSHDYDPYVIKNHFPLWFIEGYTTASENGFQYWQPLIKDARASNGKFSKESIAKFFGVASHSFYRADDGTEDTMARSYVGGYLALAYLAPMVSGVETTGATVTTEEIRNGMNTILSQLHNGTPLDTIIKNTGKYAGIDDFESKFLTADDPSSEYCVDFLNRLDAITDTNGNKANGSVMLIDFNQTQTSVLKGRTETRDTQTLMRIKPNNNFDLSTVSHSIAHMSAGVRHTWDSRDKSNANNVDKVKDMIDKLPEKSEITVNDKAQIEEARAAYNALTDEQKTEISDNEKTKLEAAEIALTNALINELPEATAVTTADKAAIEAARAAYNALSDEQKAQVPAETLKKLTDAEEALLNGSQPTIYFRCHIQNLAWDKQLTKLEVGKSGSVGTTGRSLRLEALDVMVPEGFSVTGFAHLQDWGDTEVTKIDNPDFDVPDGYTVYRFGTTGQSRRMEALSLGIVNAKGEYVQGLRYTTHLQNYSWQGYVRNGSFAGTRGMSLRLEAIRFAYTADDVRKRADPNNFLRNNSSTKE